MAGTARELVVESLRAYSPATAGLRRQCQGKHVYPSPLTRRIHRCPAGPLRFLNLLPLSHMFGQAMATFIPPMLPGTVIFMRGYNPRDMVALIKRRRASVLVSVPKMLDVLRAHVLRIVPDAATAGPKEHWAFRWWRHRHLHRLFGFKCWSFVVGAAPLDAELEAFWSARGCAVIQGYGLTETAPIVSVTHPFPEAETAKGFESGWFHTGDIGEIAPDGRLFIRGRKKEVIERPEGLKVFPDDVQRPSLTVRAGVPV